MGKIRVKTFGDEESEKKQKQKAQQKAEAKKAALAANKSEESAEAGILPVESVEEAPKKEMKKKQKGAVKKTQTHSKSYLTAAAVVDKNKVYKLAQALEVLAKVKRAKFDETVELHFNTIETGISGNVTLPHGTGKSLRVTQVSLEDAAGLEELIGKVEKGQIDFDILIATPDSMSKLARVARVLGPKGLMPNPKNGTITTNTQEAAKKFEGGQTYFKTESKFPILHLAVGKLSFGDSKLTDNIKSAVAAVQKKRIKDATLKSTISPAIKLDLSSL